MPPKRENRPLNTAGRNARLRAWASPAAAADNSLEADHGHGLHSHGEGRQALGFGLMRLPHKGPLTDVEQVKQMVDLFMEAGFTYFDTAFVYAGSEAVIRKALVERYPRASYTLATKLNAFLMAPTEKAAKRQFDTSLERTGARRAWKSDRGRS
nr:aldo/keto reductase [Olsenella profusa]